MFEMENRGELIEKIEDLVNRKRYTELRDLLLPLEPADIAILADDLDDEKTLPLLFRLLPKEQAAEVFVELESDQQELLIRGFSNTELKEVLDELYLDDTVDIVEEMPANMVKRILKHSDPDMRKSINEILKYPEDSTGSIMTTEFVDLKETMTVEDALKRIRRTGPDKETINVCYVIDDWRHLIGVLSIRTLLLAEEDDIIGDIMERNYICVQTLDDQEETARALVNMTFWPSPWWILKTASWVLSPWMTPLTFCRKRPRRIWKRWRLCCRRISHTSRRASGIRTSPVSPGCCF